MSNNKSVAGFDFSLNEGLNDHSGRGLLVSFILLLIGEFVAIKIYNFSYISLVTIILIPVLALWAGGSLIYGDEKKQEKYGQMNRNKNDKLLNSFQTFDDFFDALNNTKTMFLAHGAEEAKDNKPAVPERWLESNAAKSYMIELNDKFKTTSVYLNFVEGLKKQNIEINTDDVFNIYSNGEAMENFHLNDLYMDLTNQVIIMVDTRDDLDIELVIILIGFSLEQRNQNILQFKELGSKLKEKQEIYFNHALLANNLSEIFNIYFKYSDWTGTINLIDMLQSYTATQIIDKPDVVTNEEVIIWVLNNRFNKNMIEKIFNDERYSHYPHNDIAIHYLSTSDADQMYGILINMSNKVVYDKINSIFYTNLLVGLAMTQNKFSDNENYQSYFDNLMTEGWNTLYILELLDNNKKFIADMGNDTKRNLMAREQELKNQNKLLTETEKAAKAAEEQALAAKNAEKYAQQQADYAQQQIEYQRIQAEQARVAAANSEATRKASEATQKAVENGVIHKKQGIVGSMGSQLSGSFSKSLDV